MEPEELDMDRVLEILTICGMNCFAFPPEVNVFEALGARPYNHDGTPVEK